MSFEKPGYKVETVEKVGCRLVLRVEVSKEEVDKAFKKALKSVNKEISLPGFRKGKAPEETVLKQHGKAVEQEYRELVVNEAFREALDLVQIYPFNKESIDKVSVEKCSVQEGAVITISYEHYPVVPAINFAEIKLQRIQEPPIDQGQLDEILSEIQKHHSEFEEIMGRKALVGDFVDLTIEKMDETPPRALASNRRFEMADQRMSKWLRSMIVDLEIGQSKEALTELEENATEEQKASFTPIPIRVTLLAIKKSLLPPLDDELAKKEGFDTLEALRASIRENLAKEVHEQLYEQKVKLLEQALLETCTFALPSKAFEQEYRYFKEKEIAALEKKRLPEEERKKAEAQLEVELAPVVEKHLRLRFLLNEIGKREHISLSTEELNARIHDRISADPFYALLYKQDKETFRKLISGMSAEFLEKKVKEHILGLVKQ